MLRAIASALLLASAFAVPVPWLDRAGTAAAGLAFAALALPRRVPRADDRELELPAQLAASSSGDAGDQVDDLRSLLRSYLGGEPAS